MSTPSGDEDEPVTEPGSDDPDQDDRERTESKPGQFGADPQELQGDDPASGGS